MTATKENAPVNAATSTRAERQSRKIATRLNGLPSHSFSFPRRNHNTNGAARQDIFRLCRENVTAREVAEQYGISVNRAGFALCPFHGEKTPSLKFFDDGGFYCFGCHVGGTAIDFTARLLDVEPLEAVKRLNADFSLGLALETGKPSPEQEQAAQRRREVTEIHQRFEDWRKGMIDRLNECCQIAYAALEEGPPWTEAEELAIKWRPAIEDYADTLISDDDAAQMGVFAYREEVERLCAKILLNNT